MMYTEANGRPPQQEIDFTSIRAYLKACVHLLLCDELKRTISDPRRTKRVVKYAKGADMLDYVSGQKRLAGASSSLGLHPALIVMP